MPRISLRMLASLFYLGLLFVAAGYLYGRIQRFSGTVVIAEGRTESTVVRPAGEGLSLAPMQRRLPGEVLLFDNPEVFTRRLDPDLQYDATHLPYHLRLDEVRVLERFPPRDELVLKGPGGEEATAAAVPGETVEFGGAGLEVEAIRPWAGLIRNPSGKPTASVSLRAEAGAAWSGPIFLKAGEWHWPTPEVALLFRWCEDEPAARAQLPDAAPGPESGRWSVEEGPRRHGFNTLTPGAGAELADGTRVTLLRFDPAHAGPSGIGPAIAVGFAAGEEKTAVWVRANSAEAVRGVRFEYPPSAGLIGYIHAWRDGAALAKAFCDGAAPDARLLGPGEVLPRGAGCPFELRFGEVMESALAIPQEGAPVHELVVQAGAERIALREGRVQVHNGLRLKYLRVPTPPRVEYRLGVVGERGEALDAFVLAPGGTAQHGAWRFSQSGGNADADRTAVLHAVRTLGSLSQRIGMLMVVAGAFGWALLRLRRPRAGREGASGGFGASND